MTWAVYYGFVQTFLPYPCFQESARVLDRQRLGKQRVEAYQILRTLTGVGSQGWANHPAVRMWAGHERSLAAYGMTMCCEWRQRGYKDSLLSKFTMSLLGGVAEKPVWLGDEDFHRSHRSNLLRKLQGHYGAFWPDDPDDLPYVWPK